MYARFGLHVCSTIKLSAYITRMFVPCILRRLLPAYTANIVFHNLLFFHSLYSGMGLDKNSMDVATMGPEAFAHFQPASYFLPEQMPKVTSFVSDSLPLPYPEPPRKSQPSSTGVSSFSNYAPKAFQSLPTAQRQLPVFGAPYGMIPKAPAGFDDNASVSDASYYGGMGWSCDASGNGKEDSCSKRRQDRNAREQKRSLKISQQIGQLKDVLEVDGKKMKNSKIAILTGIEDYIRDLETQINALDLCRQKMSSMALEENGAPVKMKEEVKEKKENHVVNGVDFKKVFKGASAPLAVASLDGRFLDSSGTVSLLEGWE